MSFTTVTFLTFFPIICLVYFIVPKQCRNVCMLIGSYLFYMGWNAKYALLLLAVTIVSYLLGIGFDFVKNASIRKGMLVTAISFMVSLLGFYKYLNFIVLNINAICLKFGFVFEGPAIQVLLPVGISFYLFQALAYVIDVYRGNIEAEKNFIDYALFISFFPQLVAGPIERSSNMLHQIHDSKKQRLWNYDRITNGLVTMLWGYFMKLIIADRVAVLVDQVFNHYYRYGAVEIMFGTIMFAFQIYCDFAGYSYIAIGAAKVMGYDLMENFKAPYYARTVKEFWDRWHISLTSWFRDYVYIPLGGNRRGTVRTYINLIFVFFLSGLWHGAGWHFVAWGVLNGIYLVIERICRQIKKKSKCLTEERNDSFGKRIMDRFVTFILVDFAWLFFRADNIYVAKKCVERIVCRWNPWILFDGSLYQLGLDVTQMHILLIGLGMLLLVDYLLDVKEISLATFLNHQPIVFRYCFLVGMLIFVVVFGWYGTTFDATQFIYFQF